MNAHNNQLIKIRCEDILQKALNNPEGDKIFFLIDVICFLTTLTDIFPAELAIMKFNLEDKSTKNLHLFINPGELPLGTVNETSLKAGETHHLPLPPKCNGEQDLKIIKNQLMDFISSEEAVVLLTPKSSVNEVKRSIEKIFDDEFHEVNLLVYPIENFLKMLTRQEETQFEAQKFIDKYTDKGCDFHYQEDTPKFCSLARVYRWTRGLFDLVEKSNTDNVERDTKNDFVNEITDSTDKKQDEKVVSTSPFDFDSLLL